MMRVAILVGLCLPLGACSHDFWYRQPRVAGSRQVPQARAQAPSPYLPAPEVRVPAAAPGPARPGAAAASTPGLPTAEEQAVLEAVNRIRAARGLRTLAFHPRLHLAAQEHSREQHEHGYMGHGSPDPARRTLPQRMQQAGYDGMVFGEVVAWGYRDSEAVVEGWMNSREHRAILVDPELGEAGFARVGATWTGNFGARMRGWGEEPTAAIPRTASPSPAVPPPALRAPPPGTPRPAPRVAPAPRRPAPAPARPRARGG